MNWNEMNVWWESLSHITFKIGSALGGMSLNLGRVQGMDARHSSTTFFNRAATSG